MTRSASWEQRALRVVVVLGFLFAVAYIAMAIYIKSNPSVQSSEERRVYLVARGLTRMFVITSAFVFFGYLMAHYTSTNWNTKPLVVDPLAPKPRWRWWMKAIAATLLLGSLFGALELFGRLQPLADFLNDVIPARGDRAPGPPDDEAGRRVGRCFGWGFVAIWAYFCIPFLIEWKRPREMKPGPEVFD